VHSEALTIQLPASTMPPEPVCSINGADCAQLVADYSSSSSSGQYDQVTTVILAPFATALTTMVASSSATTTYGSAAMTPPPLITVNNTAYSADSASMKEMGVTLYLVPDEFGTAALVAGGSVILEGYYSDTQAYPACNTQVPATSSASQNCGACTIIGENVCDRRTRSERHSQPSDLLLVDSIAVLSDDYQRLPKHVRDNSAASDRLSTSSHLHPVQSIDMF
jgi:hypothetical protein